MGTKDLVFGGFHCSLLCGPHGAGAGRQQRPPGGAGERAGAGTTPPCREPTAGGPGVPDHGLCGPSNVVLKYCNILPNM